MLALGAAALLWAVASAGHAQASVEGLRLAAESRCAEALELLEEADGAPDAQRARALCLLHEARYAEAVVALGALEAHDASLSADLAIAHFHAGDLDAADLALARAEAARVARAELPLYRGLVAERRAQEAEAVAAFRRAATAADNELLSSAAGYYAGANFARAGELGAARDALERVMREWPDSGWAEAARRELERLDAARAGFATLRLGFEHDSNAVLRGDGVVLPPEIASASDQRFVWRAAGGKSWSAAPRAQVGAALSFSGSAHGDLARFDVLYPALAVWTDLRVGEHATLRAVAGYGYAWVGEDDFLSAPNLGLEAQRSWGERGATRLFAEFAFDDYRFPILASSPAEERARDRDGLGTRLGLEHRLPVAALSATASASLAYRRFSADGTEYSFDSPEVELGWESALPGKLVLGAGLRYAYRRYRHPTTFETPARERREHDWRTELALRRPVWRQLQLETRWRYQRNRSSADVFDYRRHVAGLYATWTLSP